MSKKQSRHNRGARSGGHEHDRTAAAEKKPTQEPIKKATDPSEEPARRISEHHSHKQPRKFGHN
ncbi:hypothetical protein ABZS88_25750 [Streptomyces sp. NPDC005480]|uniref:hypothetical protein n=1 Tax=Streptomyces sp. NPDC005480 TaxID=3154880 RepID=UPI0033A9D9E8